MSNHLPYNKNLKQFSRDLRNHSTPGEILLWKNLRARSMKGYQFYRQKPLENFIVDFYCRSLKLVIEIDGGYHLNPEVREKDVKREDILKQWGLQILRFKEDDVVGNTVMVVVQIEAYIAKHETEYPDCLQFKRRRPNSPAYESKRIKHFAPLQRGGN